MVRAVGGNRRLFRGVCGVQLKHHVGIFQQEVLNTHEFGQEERKSDAGVADRNMGNYRILLDRHIPEQGS